MIQLDEDALICDFAETYHILDYKTLPATLAATLAAGLRNDSRIKLLMSDQKAPIDTILLAGIVDRLSIMIGGDKAKTIVGNFITEKQEPATGFESGADFDAAWAALGNDHG